MDLTIILTSGVVAALVSALITWQSGERKIQIENITQERAKWRERIRSNALLVHQAASAIDKAKLAELHGIFRLLLNPFDEEDQKILMAIEALGSTESPQKRLPEFGGRIAYLLKHDWERAKQEAKYWQLGRKKPERKIFQG